MSYSLSDVFQEAITDKLSAKVDTDAYEARLLYGIKIVQEPRTRIVTIYNTHLGGDHYKEICRADYQLFKQSGWRHAVCILCLSNCHAKLDRLHESMERETEREPQRLKHIEGIIKQREKTEARIRTLQRKFNRIKSISHDTSQE